MKYLLTVLTIVFTTVNVCSQTLPKDATAEREILAFQKELLEAMNRKDRGMLERLIADGFTFIHSTGGMEIRKEYIDNAVAGNLASQNLNVERFDEQLRVYGGNTAIRYSRGEMRNKADNQLFPECETLPFTLMSRDGGNGLPGSQPNCRFARRQKL